MIGGTVAPRAIQFQLSPVTIRVLYIVGLGEHDTNRPRTSFALFTDP